MRRKVGTVFERVGTGEEIFSAKRRLLAGMQRVHLLFTYLGQFAQPRQGLRFEILVVRHGQSLHPSVLSRGPPRGDPTTFLSASKSW